MSCSSSAADTPLGMMDTAYFTSRRNILDFFNSLLNMNLTKIEQTATGAIACQLMDYMYPGSIPMKRVNWAAKSDFQYIENYKILQVGFTKQRVQKHVDVDRLIRAKYQDNLEFCQWLKAFFENASVISRNEYDAIGRRKLGKGGKNLETIFLPRTRSSKSIKIIDGSEPEQKLSFQNIATNSTSRSASSTSSEINKRPLNNLKENDFRCENLIRKSTPVTGYNVTAKAFNKRPQKFEIENEKLMKRNAALRRKNAEIELMIENIEKERDFYFDKLRGVEVILQVQKEKKDAISSNDSHERLDNSLPQEKNNNQTDLVDRMFRILYAKIEDNLLVTDDGELLEGIMTSQEEEFLDESCSSMLGDVLNETPTR